MTTRSLSARKVGGSASVFGVTGEGAGAFSVAVPRFGFVTSFLSMAAAAWKGALNDTLLVLGLFKPRRGGNSNASKTNGEFEALAVRSGYALRANVSCIDQELAQVNVLNPVDFVALNTQHPTALTPGV